MSRRIVPLVLTAALALAALAGSVPETPPTPSVLDAKPEEVKALVEAAQKAVQDKNDEQLAQCLREMETLRSAEFVPLIRAGVKSAEAEVIAAAVRAAASHELKDLEKDVRRLLSAKPPKKKGDSGVGGGAIAAAAVDFLVRLGFGGEEASVFEDHLVPMIGDERRLKASWSVDLMRSSLHYLGKFKYKKAVPFLIDQIPAPAPKDVNDPKNPPESYWRERTILWQKSEGWTRWALKEITGQEFRTHREWGAWLDLNKKQFK